MKKLFFIAAIASVALVSCTKNEVAPSAQQDEITFLAPVVGAQTKVNGLIGATYNKGESFDVWCVHNTSDISVWDGTVYFSDTKATWNSGLGGWALEKKYYWPSTGKLSFVAMSPSIANTTTYDKTKGFSITSAWSQGANENTIVDLMYSEPAFNKAKADYTGNEEKTGDENSYKGVDITFKHALSYITFKVKTAAEYTTTDFRLTKITLSGIYTTGTFIQKEEDSWTESTSNVGEYVAFDYDRDVPGSDPVVKFGELDFDNGPAVAVPETSGKEIILLPQALKADQQKITVNYEISTDDKAIDDPTKVWIAQTSEAVDLTNLTVDEWEMGKKYIYTITIGMNEIIFDPAVADWKTPAVEGGVSF